MPDDVQMLVHAGRANPSENPGEPAREYRPNRYRLTVAQREPGLHFQRVTEGVAVIQQVSQAGVQLVRRDDLRFPPDARRNLRDERAMAQVARADEVAARDLSVSIRPFTRGKGFQEIRITQDRAGLPVGTDQVLSFRKVNRGLPANARVHLG